MAFNLGTDTFGTGSNSIYDWNNTNTGAEMGPLSTAINAQGNEAASTGTNLQQPDIAANAGIQAPAVGATSSTGGFFQPGGGAGLALGAIQTLGSLWNSFQQTKLAEKSLALQTRVFETNLALQKKTYNTSLVDRIRTRFATEGKTRKAARRYIKKHRL